MVLSPTRQYGLLWLLWRRVRLVGRAPPKAQSSGSMGRVSLLPRAGRVLRSKSSVRRASLAVKWLGGNEASLRGGAPAGFPLRPLTPC